MKTQNLFSLKNTAMLLFFLFSALCTFTGIVYVFMSGLMPYHYEFLGKTAEQLDPKSFQLICYAKQIAGGLMAGTGIAFGMLSRKYDQAPDIILPVMAVLIIIPLAVAGYVVFSVGEFIPELLVSVLILFSAAGFAVMIKTKVK